MELEELMRKENLSQNDIIGAAKVITKVCGSVGCQYCPLYFSKECHAKDMTKHFEGEALKRFQSLLRPNYMKKVAGILGLKFSKPFTVRSRNDDEFHCYLGEKGLKLIGDRDADCRILLGDLLAGKAYIVKEDN